MMAKTKKQLGFTLTGEMRVRRADGTTEEIAYTSRRTPHGCCVDFTEPVTMRDGDTLEHHWFARHPDPPADGTEILDGFTIEVSDS